MEKEKLLTFGDLGFANFAPILMPHQPEGAYQYTRLKIKKDVKNVGQILMQSVIAYMQSAGEGHDFSNEFIGGAAYFMDGSAVITFNGMKEEAGKVTSSIVGPDHYKNVKTPEGVVLKDNIDFISKIFNARYPLALALIRRWRVPTPSTMYSE